MTRQTRDNHEVLASPLSRHHSDARILRDACLVLAVIFVVCVGIGAMAEGFRPRAGVLPVEDDDSIRSEEP